MYLVRGDGRNRYVLRRVEPVNPLDDAPKSRYPIGEVQQDIGVEQVFHRVGMGPTFNAATKTRLA